MMRISTTLLALVPAATFAEAPPAVLNLTRSGLSSYEIVRPVDSSPSQLYAAEELQKFTKQMTSAELPIVTDDQPLPAKAILLGVTRHTATVLGEQPDMAKLGDDGFRIVTKPPHVCVVGSPVRGTLYGVYELLEKYGGCRWYTAYRSVIPKLDTWTLPAVDDTQTPAFAMREPFWWCMFNGDQAARNKVNGNRPELEEKHGGKVRFGAGLFVHTFFRLMPPSEFFDEHPDYFSEIGGKRVAGRSQLCLTNPEVVRIMTERVLKAIRSDPTAKLFSVSQNDWHGFCQCANCRAVDEEAADPGKPLHSQTLIKFVNQIAEAVEKEFPDVWIETLAYQYTRTPPRTVKPRRNVVPRLCTIECDFAKPLDVSTYEQNRKFVEDIKGWAAITDKLYVWDYTTNFGHYLSPHPNFGALQGNVKFFRDHHVVGLFEQGAYQGPHAEFAELRAWLLAKLLWDPDQDVEPLYQDFFNGYYGPAAKPIRTYFDELQALVKPENNRVRIWYSPNDRRNTPYYTDKFFDRAAKLWAEAEALVKDDPALSYNVRMSALPVMYARLVRWPERRVLRQELRGGMLKPVGTDAGYVALASEFLARIAEGKVTHICESASRHTDYLSKLRSETEGYKPTWLSDGGLTAGIVAQNGGRVVSLAGADGANLLHAGAGGIDFAPDTGTMEGIGRDPFSLKTEGATATLQREVRNRYRIARTVDLKDGNLSFATTLTSTSDKAQTIQPVTRVALDLGGPGFLVAPPWSSTWTPLTVPADQTFATYSIHGSELQSRTLWLGAQKSGRLMRVRLPKADIERVTLIRDAEEESVRVIVACASQQLASGASASFGITVSPLGPVSNLPPTSDAAQHRADRVLIEDGLLGLGRPGEWGEFVADPAADDGCAVKLFNTHYEWCLKWRVLPDRLEAGGKYKLRMRIRVEKTDREGEAFWAGVYDPAKATSFGQIQPRTSQVKDGYQWYDIATWTPEAGQWLWVGPGRFDKNGGKSAIEAVYVDKYELVRAR